MTPMPSLRLTGAEQLALLRHRDDPTACARLLASVERMIVGRAAAWGRWAGLRQDLDDLASEMRLAVYGAIRTFEFDRGASFSTHAMWWIDAAARLFIRAHRHGAKVTQNADVHIRKGDLDPASHAAAQIHASRRPDVRLDADAVHLAGTHALDLPDAAPLPAQLVEDAHDTARLREAITHLPARERLIMELRLDGLMLQEIGKRLGIARQRVQQLEARAIQALGHALRGPHRRRPRFAALDEMRGSTARRAA